MRKGRCAEHEAAWLRRKALIRRAAPARSVYDDPRWQKVRHRAIERAGGRCQGIVTGARCAVTGGLHGHHSYPGGVEQMLVDGIDPFDIRWIVVLCATHHGQVEAWNRAQRRRNPSFGR